MPLLFFLFPLTGLYNGIKYFFQSKYRYGLLIFAFWYGYSVFFYSGDVTRYRDDFAALVQYTWDDFSHLVQYLFDENTRFNLLQRNTYNSKPDLYALTLGFLVSRFTENPRWFFGIVSVIYVFIILKFLDEVIRFTGRSDSKSWKLFFAGLVLIVPFYVGVTGVRFWPALFVFAWMLLKYINTGNIRYLFYTAFSVFFHYTFIFPVVVAILAAFLRINRIVFKYLVIIGVFFAVLSSTSNTLDFITNSIKVFESETVSNASASYLDEEQLEKRFEEVKATNWYVQGRVQLLNLFFILFFIFDFFQFNSWNKTVGHPIFDRMYHFFFLITLFTFNLGSMGRFIYVFYLLIFIRILQLQTVDQTKKLRVWNKAFTVVLLFHIIVVFRAGFYTVDPLLLISPSPALLFFHSDVSLSEFIVGH